MHGPRRSQRLCKSAPNNHPGFQDALLHKHKYPEADLFHDDSIPSPKRLRLTEKNLTKHRRLQQYPIDDTMGRSRKTPSSSSRTTITTTDKQFGARLRENNIVFEIFRTVAPLDADLVKKALLQKREIPRSAHESWEQICEAKEQMANGDLSLESMIVETMLLQRPRFRSYLRYRNDQWTEVENELTAGISDPKPDVTESYTWSAYPPGTQEDFGELVVSQYGYSMPTFAMESKGPSGDHEQAVKQAAYDGAIMTHAAIAIDGHVGKGVDVQFRKTKAITVTLSAVEICVYANHAIPAPDKKKTVYHQHRILKISYIESEEKWNKAHQVMYNAQEFAFNLANSRIKDLKGYFAGKEAKEQQLKVKQKKLQAKALADVAAIITPPISKHHTAAHGDSNSASTSNNTASNIHQELAGHTSDSYKD